MLAGMLGRKAKEKTSALQRGLQFVQQGAAELEARGLDEEGLYRLPGQSSVYLQLYRDCYEKGHSVHKVVETAKGGRCPAGRPLSPLLFLGPHCCCIPLRP